MKQQLHGQADPHFNAPAFSVRIAGLGDVPQLEEVVQLAYRGGKASVPWKNEHTQVVGPRVTLKALQELLESEGSTVLLAETSHEQRRRIAGCVLIELDGDDCIIGMLAVHPQQQNVGLGKMLVQAAEQHAFVNLGCKCAKMWVLSGRDELLAWYQRLGYEKTGESFPFLGAAVGVVPVDPEARFVVIAKPLR